MSTTTEIGRDGEQAATDFLVAEGFCIAERNWRRGHCELDIIAIRDGVLHVVEVKLRKKGSLTTPEEAITRTKFNSICRATSAYITMHKLDMEVQFDLVAIDSSADGYQIRYIPNVMTPRW